MTCAGGLTTPAETTAEVIMPFADLRDVKIKSSRRMARALDSDRVDGKGGEP